MRDPARINRILNQLKVLWMSYPDLRLGQLIDSIRFRSPDTSPDMFMLEDEEWEKLIQESIKKGF